MNQYEENLKKIIEENNIFGEYLSFTRSCHSVKEASEAANANIKDFVKNICLIDPNGNLLLCIVKGEDHVSISRVEKTLNTKEIRAATAEEILQKTGYPCGGTPSFGFNAKFIIDPKVMEKEIVYTSGGSENSLLKISTKELHKANNAEIIRVRK